MNPTQKKVLRWILSLVLVAVLVGVAARSAGQLRDYAFELRPIPVLIAIGFYLLYLLGRGLSWHLLLVWSGAGESALSDVGAWVSSVALGKYIPGKVAVYAGRIYWYRSSPASKVVITACFVLDLVGSVVSAAVVILLATLFTPLGALDAYRLPIFLAAAASLPLIHPRVLRAACNLAQRLLRLPPFEWNLKARHVFAFTLTLVFDWLLMGLGAAALVAAVAPVEPGHVLLIAAAFVVSAISGMVALFAPAGLGVREGVFALVLTSIYPASIAALISLLSRVWLTAIDLGLLLVLYPIFLKTSGNAKEAPDSERVEEPPASSCI